MTGDDAAAIDSRAQALQAASMKLGEAMYKAGQAQAGEAPPPGAGAGGDDAKVVDAEYEEVRDDDKRSGSA